MAMKTTPRLTSSPIVRALGLLAIALLLSLLFWWPMLAAAPKTEGGDGPVFHKMLEAARVTVVRYHEFPLWNSYECGGLPLWDNPQAPLGAPLIWPIYFIGTLKTMHLWLVVHTMLGFVSMWLLARRELRLSRGAAFVAAGAWAFSGFFQNHLPGGHFVFASFEYFPIGILFWRRAENDLRMAIGLGLLVALMIYEGGIYPIPHLAVILGIETLTRVWPPKRLAKIALAGVVVVAVALTVGAARFLPVIDQVRSHTRGVAAENDALHWGTFKDIMLVRAHERFVPGQRYVWGEYGMYIGPFILFLAVVGIVLAGAEQWWMMVLLASSIVFMIGDAGKWAPWSVLRAHVFPFKDMRVPSRFNLEVTLFLTAFAGLAVDRVVTHAKKIARSVDWREGLRVGVLGLALVGVGDIIGAGIPIVESQFQNTPEDLRTTPSPRLYLGSRAPNMVDGPRENLGRRECWEEWGFGQGAPLWDGDVPQARAIDDRAVVADVERTPNTFTFDVDAKETARILLNTTYDKGWRTTTGNVIEQDDKQLAIDVPPGKARVVVRYRPKSFTLGVILTLTGLMGSMMGLWWLRRRKITKITGAATNRLEPTTGEK